MKTKDLETASPESKASSLRPAWRTWLIGAVALGLVLASVSYFTRQKSNVNHAKPAAGAPVRVGIVARQDMGIIERSAGSVLAETVVQVFPRVAGELKRQWFHEGQFVNKGDLLFDIDPEPYRAAVEQARGVYEKDLALLQNAKLDLQRSENLFKQAAVSQQSRDTAAANASVLAATAASDKAALGTALLNLGYARIRSPINGKTGAVLIQPGNLVNPSSTTALVTITQVRPVKVSFTLPQNDLPRLQAQLRAGKLQAKLEIPAAEGTEAAKLAAPVNFVGNNVNTQSGTIELRATFPNDALTLVPGQLVQVVVELGDLPNALVLPRNAVNDSPAGPYVYVVEQGKAVVKPVTVLFDDGANDAVSGDLQAGDQVITEGQLRVEAGAAVQVLGKSIPPPKMASDKIHPAR